MIFKTKVKITLIALMVLALPYEISLFYKSVLDFSVFILDAKIDKLVDGGFIGFGSIICVLVANVIMICFVFANELIVTEQR